jgi:hypothetical protein
MKMAAFSSVRLIRDRHHLSRRLSFVFSVIASMVIVEPALCDPPNDRHKVFGIGEADSNKRKEIGASDDEISKAYMNCLMDVDLMAGDLVANDKHRARLSETKTQLAFCENRKQECKMRPGSPDCKVFIEEFVTDYAQDDKAAAN